MFFGQSLSEVLRARPSGSECLRWEGPTTLKLDYLIIGPNWDPHTEAWHSRALRAQRGGLRVRVRVRVHPS